MKKWRSPKLEEGIEGAMSVREAGDQSAMIVVNVPAALSVHVAIAIVAIVADAMAEVESNPTANALGVKTGDLTIAQSSALGHERKALHPSGVLLDSVARAREKQEMTTSTSEAYLR